MAIQFPINPQQGQQYTPAGIPLTWQYDSGRHAWRVLRSAASWNEIGGKPATFPPSAHSHIIADVTGLQDGLNLKQDSSARGFPNGYASLDGNGLVPTSQLPPLSETDWNQIENKPSEFPPSAHSHPVAQISDSSSVGQQLVRSPTAQDARNVIGAIGPDDNARVKVKLAGVSMGIRRAINFIEGLNVTLAVADDAVNEEVDVTINSSGGGGGGASILVSETKPVAPADNTMWLDSATGITYIYYNDGGGHQWIEPLPYIPAQPAAYTKIVFPVAPVNDQAFTAYAGAVWKWSSVRGVWYAAQTASQSYTKAEADTKFVDIVGDTMTGALTLSGNPTAPLQAATKQYVDSKAPIIVSDTPPPTPLDNTLWWESDTGILYLRYNDGVGPVQWVQAVATPVLDTSALVKKAGDTMTGNLVISTPAGNASLTLNSGISNIEIGRMDGVASTPFIDFHSGAAVTDFDARLIASGSGAAAELKLDGGNFVLPRDPTSGLHAATKQYVDLKTSNRQRFTLDGLNLIDIPVPANAVAARLSGSAYFAGAGSTYPMIQLSTSAGVFINSVGGYVFSGNQFTAYPAAAWAYYTNNASIAGFFLVQTQDNSGLPFTWDGMMQVKRKAVGNYFSGDFISRGYNNATGHGIFTLNNRCQTPGTGLSVLAIRFILYSGTLFDTNSVLIVEWL
jgi:hypothetical protein